LYYKSEIMHRGTAGCHRMQGLMTLLLHPAGVQAAAARLLARPECNQ
jgi:hypothetical protein